MKRSAFRGRKSAQLPIVWREYEYAALRAGAEASYDDRVSGDIFDAEDERAEVDRIVRSMLDGAN